MREQNDEQTEERCEKQDVLEIVGGKPENVEDDLQSNAGFSLSPEFREIILSVRTVRHGSSRADQIDDGKQKSVNGKEDQNEFVPAIFRVSRTVLIVFKDNALFFLIREDHEEDNRKVNRNPQQSDHRLTSFLKHSRTPD